MSLVCNNCNVFQEKEKNKTQWWHCRDYFAISGIFCGECYSLISHDCYGRPVNPDSYNAVLQRYKNEILSVRQHSK